MFLVLAGFKAKIELSLEFAEPSVPCRWTYTYLSPVTLYSLFVRAFIFFFFPGLAFSTQICDEVPVTERDMTLDHVISSEPD